MIANINKFKEDVKKYKLYLEEQLSSLKSDFDLLNIIKGYLNDGDYQVLFALLDSNFDLDDSLINIIKALQYFHENDKVNLPQFKNLLDSISNCELFVSLNNKKDDLDEKVKILEENIVICENIINGNDYDPNAVLKVLDEYDYSREEVLEILSILAKEMCPARVVEKEVEIEEEVELQVVDSSLTEKKKQIIESNKELFDLIDKLVTDHYNLIQRYNSDPKLSGYLNLSFEVLKEAEKDISELNYKEISFVMLINKLIENKKVFFDMVMDATGEDDLEYLKEEPANLREQYKYVLQNVPESVVEKDMVSSSGKKVVFLTDDNNNVCFNSSLITQNASILDKLSKGLFDYKKGKKPSYIKGVRNTDYLVRINMSGNDCCSFIELPNDIVLVVTIGSYDDVISNSIQLANKYDSKIENFREMALNDSELLVTMNDSIVNLSSGDGRKG